VIVPVAVSDGSLSAFIAAPSPSYVRNSIVKVIEPVSGSSNCCNADSTIRREADWLIARTSACDATIPTVLRLSK